MCHINGEQGHFPTRPTDGFTDWLAERLIDWFCSKRKTHFSPLRRTWGGGGLPFSGSHDVIRIGSNDLSIITTIMKQAAFKSTSSSECCLLMPTAIAQSAKAITTLLLPDLLPNHSRNLAGRQKSFVWIRERDRESECEVVDFRCCQTGSRGCSYTFTRGWSRRRECRLLFFQAPPPPTPADS